MWRGTIFSPGDLLIINNNFLPLLMDAKSLTTQNQHFQALGSFHSPWDEIGFAIAHVFFFFKYDRKAAQKWLVVSDRAIYFRPSAQ
jgi:hypothetical protein